MVGGCYMSKYSFIASDYELPEVENSKIKIITVKEAISLGLKPPNFISWEEMEPDHKVLIAESEDDLGELEIREYASYDEDVKWYTTKPFIYSVEFNYSEARVKQLLEYIKQNKKKGYELELWSIWLGETQEFKPSYCKHDEISLDHIKKVYKYNFPININYICIIIEE